jgi:hypothetical protein
MFLSDNPNLVVVGLETTAEAALTEVEHLRPDLVQLGIQLNRADRFLLKIRSSL